uniref:DUF6470 family protein n=1 Tax=Paenibacillus polymyxa TaxID=1406 RepID=A0AAE9IDT0_PAEPO
MSIIPTLQIRQTPAILHIDADPGQYSIRQPSADMELTTRRAQLEIHQYKPQLTIDQSAAFSAYNGGNYLEMNNRIYSGVPQIFLQALAHKVEQGNRMAAIHIPGNTVANVFGEDTETHVLPEFRGQHLWIMSIFVLKRVHLILHIHLLYRKCMLPLIVQRLSIPGETGDLYAAVSISGLYST